MIPDPKTTPLLTVDELVTALDHKIGRSAMYDAIRRSHIDSDLAADSDIEFTNRIGEAIWSPPLRQMLWIGPRCPDQRAWHVTREPKRPTPAPRQTPEKGVSAAVASIRARFGYCAIGLGYCGIRYSAREPS